MIDLHTHSTYSDGTDTPEQLIEKAASKGITTIALCDHDTVAGIQQFIDYAAKFHIHAISGIEISAEWISGECHILGLGIDHTSPEVKSYLSELKESRDERNIRICQKLNTQGISISIEEVAAEAGGDIIARPHIANVLVKKGICSSIDDAFTKYLARGAAAHVKRLRLSPLDAISFLKNNNASVFLAHPSKLHLPVDEFRKFIQTLIPIGLDGLEVFTPYSTDDDIEQYLTLCKEFGMKISGGSDYHGSNKQDHYLGYYRTDKAIPVEYINFIK